VLEFDVLGSVLRLSALIYLYIYLLKEIFYSRHHKIHSFFSHPSILYIIIYPLWDLLVTLSKYIHVTSCFEVFIETNLMVQSKFNLVFWFSSYNIFFVVKLVEPALVVLSLLLSLSRACVGNSIVRIGELRYLPSVTLNNADVLVL
jgi:hypothetical protein